MGNFDTTQLKRVVWKLLYTLKNCINYNASAKFLRFGEFLGNQLGKLWKKIDISRKFYPQSSRTNIEGGTDEPSRMFL